VAGRWTDRPVRVSFVIPTLNEASNIAPLLDYLQEAYPHCERIVIDGGSSDDTVRLAMPRCDQFLLGRAGRASQMNLGARVATGDYLFFLHADTRPTLSAARLHSALAEQPVWGFNPVQFTSKRFSFRVISWFMNHRSRLTHVATGDQMLFAQRQVFLEQGPYADIKLMEDIALCKRLRRLAKPLVLPEPVVTSSRRWEEQGVVRTVVRMWMLRLAYVCGASPQTLWRFYYRNGFGGRHGS